MASRPVLKVSLSKTFPGAAGQVLREFSLQCSEGEIVAIVGPSGCGKSTILNILSGITSPDPQSIMDIVPHRLGYAFQRPWLAPWRTSTENAYLDVDHLSMDRKYVSVVAMELLALVGLSEFRDSLPRELSVGMQQRLQLVRVLTAPADLYLLDEPLGGVDQPLRIRLARAVRALLQERNAAALWVTHDSREAVEVADRVVVIESKPGRTVASLTVNRALMEGPTPPALGRDESTFSGTLDEQAASILGILTEHSLQEEVADSIAQKETGGVRTLRAGLRGAWSRLALATAPLVLLLAVWELVVAFRPGLEFFISKPSVAGPRLLASLTTGELLFHLIVTAREAAGGLVIGVPLGLLIGFSAAMSWRLSVAVRPYLVGLTAVPLFVLAPAFILWLGVGEEMKVAVAAVSCFPFVGYLVHEGALATQGAYFNFMKRQGAHWLRLVLHSMLPGSLDAVIRSLRPAAVAALIGAFLGEFIAANKGLGYVILFEASRYRVAEVLGGVAVLFSLAVSVELLTDALARNSARIIARLRL